MLSIEVVIPVKNPGRVFAEVIESWLNQQVGQKCDVKICVVDDGSTESDSVIRHLPKLEEGHTIRVIRNEKSLGRGGAVNAGAVTSVADYLIILDADCRAESELTLMSLLPYLGSNAAVVFGKLKSEGFGFWSEYFNQLMLDREREFYDGNPLAFSTQYCAVSREYFVKSGGFDCAYTHYGFEDRDWIIRLIEMGVQPEYAVESAVYHDDDISLPTVCKKMFEAGSYTSYIFRARHPEAYAEMAYSRVDINSAGFFSRVLLCFFSLFRQGVLVIAKNIVSRPLPFFIKRFFVRLASAVFYFSGTRYQRQYVAEEEM
ncbi:Glycosyltransferase, GT2 family [Halopseudomonas sabulinigri]|uniref:Glycosyltransferase, GT2 family n=2 Tax=Halopseudomonas sabulinigri TaxID=472181 RepID=A0A1H1QYM0_9GAMM|nr:Glycosyltransferase, GT2 family [Halopseudomonas sabulinigri]